MMLNPADSTHGKRAQQILEFVFLFLCGIYYIYYFSSTTTWMIPFPEYFHNSMLFLMSVVALARLLFIGPYRKETWLALATAAIFYMVFRADRYSFLLSYAVMIVGFIDIDYRKILKMYLIAVGIPFVATIIGGMTGAIINLVYYRDGLRSSWGICYPTDFSASAFFVLLVLWVYLDVWPEWIMLLPCLGAILLSVFVTQSRNGVVCSILLFALMLYYLAEKRWIKRNRKLNWIIKTVNFLLTAAFPLCAIIIYLLIYLYSKGTFLGAQMNVLLSDRLMYSLEGIRVHPITLFGTPFDLVGNGFSEVPPIGYNFIDSSYVLIPLRYGIVTLLLSCILWGLMVRKGIRVKDRRWTCALGAIAFHAMIEHHFLDPSYNILLMMPFALYQKQPAVKHNRYFKERRLIADIVVALACAAAVIVLPTVFSWLTTLFAVKGWTGGGYASMHSGAVILVGLLLVVAAAWSIYRVVIALRTRRYKGLYALIALFVCGAATLGFFRCSNTALIQSSDAYEDQMDADSDVLELSLENATGRVYVGQVPALYKRRFSDISYTALPIADIARFDNATLLTDSAPEYNAFFKQGYLFAQISQARAIYTRDQGVVDSLSAAGFAFSDYYSAPVAVDLDYEAHMNNLERSEQGGLQLNGSEKALFYGPYTDVTGGGYETVYDLSLPDNDYSPDDLVCTLYVYSYWGTTLLAEQPVYRSQFDDQSHLNAFVNFECGPSRSLEFKAIPCDGKQVTVNSIIYRKTHA